MRSMEHGNAGVTFVVQLPMRIRPREMADECAVISAINVEQQRQMRYHRLRRRRENGGEAISLDECVQRGQNFDVK